MNGRDQVNQYAKLINSDQRAPGDSLWPPSKLKPGDKVTVGNNPTVCTVVEAGDPLVRLVTPRGIEIKCGWKAIRKAD